MTASNQHSELDDLVAKARLYANRKDHTSGEAYVAIITAINALVEQLEAAQERLNAYEEPGWINPVQKVIELKEQLETCRAALEEIAADTFGTLEPVRRKARAALVSFSASEPRS